MRIEKLTYNDCGALTKYLESVHNDFDPPLFDRVASRSDTKTIAEYTQKLIERGQVFVIKVGESEEIAAVIAIYVNDHVLGKAYISILSVMGNFKGRGFASMLVQESIKCAINSGMKEIHVKTWPSNKNAIRLYSKFDFRVAEETQENIRLVKFL